MRGSQATASGVGGWFQWREFMGGKEAKNFLMVQTAEFEERAVAVRKYRRLKKQQVFRSR